MLFFCLLKVFRKMEGDSLERSNCQWRSESSQADNCLEQSVANLNTVIANLETQAVQIIKVTTLHISSLIL